jgi:hypothetical protein
MKQVLTEINWKSYSAHSIILAQLEIPGTRVVLGSSGKAQSQVHGFYE